MKAAISFLFFISLLLSEVVFGSPGAELLVQGDDVVIFSGPSSRYRPIETASEGDRFPVSLQKVPAQKGSGDYYKVLVIVKPGKTTRVGYIFSASPVQIQPTNTDENVDSYKDVALANSAIQVAFASLESKNYQIMVGYLAYPFSNLYLKAFVGQALSTTKGGFMAGGEAGLDHFISGPLSVYLSLGTGALFSSGDDLVFAGSKLVNPFVQMGAGFRYAAGFHTALSIGFTESCYFNEGNGTLLTGGMIGFEVGL